MRFRMVRINVGQFAILKQTPPESNIEYAVGVGFNYSLEGRRIAVQVTLDYLHNNEKFLFMQIICEFSIHPQDWNNSIKNGRITITKDMLEYFTSQSIGTARGVLYCRTEGTPFNYLIIPPVNVTKLVDTGMEFEVN